MAVLARSSASSSSKENAPPLHLHAVAVKSHRMKRPGAGGVQARRRAPLRDITDVFLGAPPHSAAATSGATPLSSREGLAPFPVSARSGATDVVAAMGRRSLRKDFR